MTARDPARGTPLLLLERLDQRLRAAASCVLAGMDQDGLTSGEPGTASAQLLPLLVEACGPEPGPEHWMLLTAVSGAFPLPAQVEQLARDVALQLPHVVVAGLLGQFLDDPGSARLEWRLRVVADAVVVDVDYCAQHDTHTGIQRVVRETLPRWARDHRIVPVANVTSRTVYRSLTDRETARVLEFGSTLPAPVGDESEDVEPELIVPWRTTVVWPEVVDPHACTRLAALAQYSGNTVGLVAYDMIPILSTELRPFGESGIFARFLSAVKYADRVAGISSSAMEEFQGFADMLGAQGLPGPQVVEIELPEDIGEHEFPAVGTYASTRPLVLITGRREPHKNVRAALHAAERLWSEGLDFEVVMLGSRGWDERLLTETMDRLKADGRPLTTLGWVTDEEMWGRIRDASFVVFASLHEGYGLPISEALACGTPVVTTNYGSQLEIGGKGGCLLVDPRDDAQLTAAMRELITDPARLAQLRAEIPDRPQRRWDDYARQLWTYLVEGKA
ncbi:MAG: glycosyltransferase family 1 protein [Lapillicoccus sp.]